MASISQLSDGKKLIQFIDAEQKRRTIRLGKVSLRQAEAVRSHIEHLVACSLLRHSIETRTAVWLSEIPAELHRRLAATGLIEARDKPKESPEVELKTFLDKYIKIRSADVKPATATVWRRARKHLVEFFGEDKNITVITAGDCKDFRSYLKLRGLAENTIRRTCGVAKQFLEDAYDRELINRNPFRHRELPTSTDGNKKRQFFIDRPTTEKVLNACPNNEWRLIFSLCRYGGLRCPSELRNLKLSDVNWAEKRILVTSPKTERHEGQESRIIPLFPELEKHLLIAAEEAIEGQVNVLKTKTGNLRTHMQRIIEKAGVPVWPKLFQNLRSSRQTELEQEYPSYVVCAWMGNSQAIARKHYLQVIDDHFEQASGAAECAAQTAPKQTKLDKS